MKSAFKAILGIFVLFSTLAFLGGVASFVWAYQEFNKPNSLSENVNITIPSGSHIGEIATLLHEENVIDQPILFSVAGRLTDQARKLKAGEYNIPAKASMKDILDLLESGKVVQRNVTIREGLTNWEVKNLLLSYEGLLTSDDFELLVEGSYLPETYSYQKGDTALDVMSRMNRAMEDFVLNACGILLERVANSSFNDLVQMDCPSAPEPLKTIQDVLTLASIVEKETAVPSERKRVAGVFINRLRRGMLLQTDPTVIYAHTMGKHKNDGQGPLGRRLLKKDLAIDSPYNTYKYVGLPPTPIANPGTASINATLNPEAHDYIYFVADGTGGHAFAKTLNQHNANVAKWRKIRQSQ